MTRIAKYDPIRGVRISSSIDGAEAVAQKVFIRLSTHRGEWELDQTVGLPWKRWLQASRTPVDEMRDEILREISRTSGVILVTATGTNLDVNSGEVFFSFDVKIEPDSEEIRSLRLGIRDSQLFHMSLNNATIVGIK